MKRMGWKGKAVIGFAVGSIALGIGIGINAEPNDRPTRPLYDSEHRPATPADAKRGGKSNVPKVNSRGELIGYADWDELVDKPVGTPPDFGSKGGPHVPGPVRIVK